MRKEIAIELNKRATEVAKMYSNSDREKNTNNEIFSVLKIIPMSEFTAAVIYEKEPTKKQSVAFFYWINTSGGLWAYFFPTDSHILGMEIFGKIKQKIEMFNFDKN